MLLWLEVEGEGKFPNTVFDGEPIVMTGFVTFWDDLGLGEQMNVRPHLRQYPLVSGLSFHLAGLSICRNSINPNVLVLSETKTT